MESSVVGMRRFVGDEVIRAGIADDALELAPDVVSLDDRPAAGLAGQRLQHVAIADGEIHHLPWRRGAPRAGRHALRIDRIDRDVGAVRRLIDIAQLVDRLGEALADEHHGLASPLDSAKMRRQAFEGRHMYPAANSLALTGVARVIVLARTWRQHTP